MHKDSCPTQSKSTTLVLAAPNALGPVLLMSLKWFLGMAAKLLKLLHLPEPRIVLDVSDVRLLVQLIFLVLGSISEMKQPEVWAWLTKS